MIKVAVVIPTCNRRALLEKALFSVFNQTVHPNEVIVVDDNSTDGIDSSVFSGAPESINCVLLKNKINRGGNYCRNTGVETSTADVICFLDDDDSFNPRKIESVRDAAIANPSMDVFYHPAKVSFPNEGVGFITKPKRAQSQNDFLRQLLVMNIVGGTPMVSVRRDALLQSGGFDEDLGRFQDYELWLRLAITGKKFHLINEPLTNYNYFSRQKSVTRSYNMTRHSIDYIRRKHQSLYNDLSSSEQRQHACWAIKTLVRAAVLNYDRYSAVRFQLMSLYCRPTISGIFSLPVLAVSPRLAILLQAKMSGG